MTVGALRRQHVSMTWTTPEVARIDPPYVADERTMLDGWLDYHRQTLLSSAPG